MSLRSPKAQGHVIRAILCGNLNEKCRTPSPQEPFCMEIYRKTRTWTWHESHSVLKFTGKVPHTFCGARIRYGNSQEKNAPGHGTRAILYGNLQEKCRPPR